MRPYPDPLSPEAPAIRPIEPVRRPPYRWGRHLVLFAATVFTTMLAGVTWRTGVDPFSLYRALLADPAVLLFGARFSMCVVSILLAHEMGHYLVCRYYGVPATLPFLIPVPPPFPVGTLGAVIRIRGRLPDRNALFDMAAAGPLAGYVVAVPLLVFGLLRGTPAEVVPPPGTLIFGDPLIARVLMRLFDLPTDLMIDDVYIAAWFGVLLTSLNLFPVGQLDGGHIAYAVSVRIHRATGSATLILTGGTVALSVAQGDLFPAYLIWFLLLLWMRKRPHPPLTDETAPLSTGRRVLALLMLLIFVLSFVPRPIYIA